MNDNAERGHAVLHDAGVVLAVPYNADYVELLKAEVPASERSYYPATQRWTITKPYVGIALEVAEQFFTVTVEDWRSPPWPTPWARAMFDGLPERLHDGVYRVLLRTFKADIGADPTAAWQLTTEYEFRRREQVAS